MKINKTDWDLESLLHNKTLEVLYKEWFNGVTQQCKLLNSFYKTKANFVKWLNLELKVNKLANRLSNYISNHHNEELNNPTWIGWEQKLLHDVMIFAQKLSKESNLIIKNEKVIRSYLKDEKISAWNRKFELIFKNKKHILDNKSEGLLSKLSADGNAVGDIFTTLTDSDLKFADAIDKNKKHHKINTFADVIKCLKNNKDQALRKSAWISYNQAFNNVKTTLSKTLYYNYLRVNTWAKVRKFKNYIDAALDNDEVNEKLLLSVYDNVASYKDLNVKFKTFRNKMIKKMFKIKELEPWDLNLDLTTKSIRFNIEQAKKDVLIALKPLGNEYLKVVNKAFNEHWISWLPKQHKLTGAYSIASIYGLDKYYILTNFDNTSDAVSTIAHEMGHSVNSYFVANNQSIYAWIDMVTAEIASIVNEMLLNFYWLKKYKNDKKMLAHIYDNMLSTFFGCASRQIVFSKYEYEINKLVNEGKPFTIEVSDKVFTEVRKQYEGISKKSLEKMNKFPYSLANAGILRIPHFYANNFYVWKYAISQIVAIVIAKEIYSGNKTMLNNYIKFLKVGTSKPPLETIKILGIDLTKSEVYLKAKNILNLLVKQFVKLK